MKTWQFWVLIIVFVFFIIPLIYFIALPKKDIIAASAQSDEERKNLYGSISPITK